MLQLRALFFFFFLLVFITCSSYILEPHSCVKCPQKGQVPALVGYPLQKVNDVFRCVNFKSLAKL